jgi:outer membrane protein assembly factor BamB
VNKALVALLLSLCSLCLGSASRAGDWPQFRGPGGSGVAEEKGLPVRWSTTENVRWRADLPGRGVCNPAIAGGRVYITASSGYRQDRLHVLCLDFATGKKLWERQFWATGSTTSNPKTCMAGPSPVTDGEHVYALFATGDLVCLDRDGNLVWYRALERDYPLVTNQVGMAASPLLYRDVLVVPLENAGDSFVAGLDRRSGRNLWKHQRARDINWVSPVLLTNRGRTDLLVQSRHELTAYDPESGSRRWAFTAEELADVPSPVTGTDTVLLSAHDAVVALRPPGETGTPEVAWRSTKLRAGAATPLVYQGRVYQVNSARVLLCAEADTGKVVWQQRLGLEGIIWASPVAADGKVYVVNEAGTTAVVQAGDTPRLLGSNALDETILATPALAGGAVFLRSDPHLYCIGAKNGK